MNEEHVISVKVKEYLIRKLEDCRHELIKLRRKRKRVKILYVSTVISSIIISTVAVSLTSIISIPIVVITVLSASSAILTAVSTRVNFQNKKVEISNLIKRLNQIQSKLDYVISCNENLTQTEYIQILKEFTF